MSASFQKKAVAALAGLAFAGSLAGMGTTAFAAPHGGAGGRGGFSGGFAGNRGGFVGNRGGFRGGWGWGPGAVIGGLALGAALGAGYYYGSPYYYGGGPYYGYGDYGYGDCYPVRQRAWNGWAWTWRSVEVCQ